MEEKSVVYPRAPITEALLDIRVAPRAGMKVDDLRPITERLKEDYPAVEERHVHAAQLTITTTPGVQISQTQTGLLARSVEGDRVYQPQLGGLSVSKLAPYRHWADLKAEAQRIWAVYKEVAQPTAITRLALRYINRIDVPGPGGRVERLSDYLRAAVELPTELPYDMTQFFFQVHLSQQDIGGLCVINSAGLPPTSSDVLPVLLDLDLFKQGDIPQTDEEMWLFFDQLRLRKNKIFEACITDRARELFR